jgi:hypothetical protein
VDLSTAGARIEHQTPLDPGSTWGVELPLAFGSMNLQARVVHTGPVGDAKVRDADALLRYQSGLAFFGMTRDQQATLTRRLNTLYPSAEAKGLDMARGVSCEGDTIRLRREGNRLIKGEG